MAERITHFVQRTSPHTLVEPRLELPPDYADWTAFRSFAAEVHCRGHVRAGVAWRSVQNVCIGQGPTEYSPLRYLADPDIAPSDRESVKAVSLTSVAERLISSRMAAEAWPRCSAFGVAFLAGLALDQCVDSDAIERLEKLARTVDHYPVPKRSAVDTSQVDAPQRIEVPKWGVQAFQRYEELP